MKRIFKLIVCAMAIGIMSSCDSHGYDNSSRKTNRKVQIHEVPDSIQQKMVGQDDTMKKVPSTKVDTLSASSDSNKNKVAKSRGFESTAVCILIINTVITILLIVLFPKIDLFIKRKREGKEGLGNNNHDNSEENPRAANGNNSSSSQHNNRNTQVGSWESGSGHRLQDLENRLQDFENKLEKFIADAKKETYSKQHSDLSCQRSSMPQENDQYPQQVKYAKAEDGKYFTTLYDSNQEGCVFKITLTGQDKGKFSITALKQITSRNNWQDKVEYSGVSIKEASSFKLEEEGVCEKTNNGFWTITKPLKIKLLN